MTKIYPVTVRRSSAPPPPPGGGPTASWAEDAGVDDAVRLSVALAEDGAVDDALALALALAEDAATDDTWAVIIAANFAEDGGVDDALALALALAEDGAVDDALALALALAEDAGADDALLLAAALAEDGAVNDLVKVELAGVIVGRTATPDTDLMGDGWTDQAATGVNHGNESLIVKGKSTLANDERRAHLFIDLSQYTGFTGIETGLTLTIKASNAGALLAETITWSAQDTATRSFTESTLTWANQPATATTRGTGTFSLPAGGAVQTIALVITAANITACAGRWLLLTFTAATAAAPNTCTILARDDATAGNRPTYTITRLQRGT